jgi:antitoxin component of MazEF toxin-antitoxin module
MNIPKELMKQIELYSESIYVNKTSAVIFLITQSLREDNAMKLMQDAINIANEQKEKEKSSGNQISFYEAIEDDSK